MCCQCADSCQREARALTVENLRKVEGVLDELGYNEFEKSCVLETLDIDKDGAVSEVRENVFSIECVLYGNVSHGQRWRCFRGPLRPPLRLCPFVPAFGT